MAQLSYLAFTFASPPYIGIVKDVDGAMSRLDPFPFLESPSNLKDVAWSPSGKYVMASRASSATITVALRVWEMTEIDTFVEWPLSGMITSDWVGSGGINDIAWYDDDHVLIATSYGVFAGTLDRVNKKIALVRLSATIANSLEIIDGTTALISYNTAPSLQIARRTADAVTLHALTGITLPSVVYRARRMAGSNIVVILTNNTVATYGEFNFATGAVSAVKTVELGASPVGSGAAKSSPDGAHYYFSITAVPRWSVARRVGSVFVPTGADSTLLPALGSTLNAAAFSPDGLRIALAINSNNATIGRMQIAQRDPAKESAVLMAEHQALVADIGYNFNGVAWSPAIAAGATVNLYNRTLDRIAPGGADLTNLKALFLTAAGVAAFDATHTTLTQARGANEATGSDWPVGGVTLTGVEVVEKEGGAAGFRFQFPPTMLNADGDLTFRGMLVYEGAGADNGPIAMLDFGEDKTAVQYDVINLDLLSGDLIVYTPAA